MEPIQPPSRPTGPEKGPGGDTLSTRPRASSERDLMRSSMSIQRPDENRSPANSFSRACEGMLKTTTETGDIGMFSIKPSRVPQSLGTPRRLGAGYNPETGTGHQTPRQNFQPYGVPVVDDRRRLPSYARDAASEVISMYESASQKSASRLFDEPDYRSYSMTQTSYSSYTLSNHRSYNSLRSQADANTQVQRPRSPFAYPARLKRPGFRPSSPALTDGGIVDYSRRAEIERVPQGAGHSKSSPSSLYAQRRRPHQSLRPDANRSTPSLLSQSSPPRRSSSPLVSRTNAISSHDWARRPGPASVNTSPARSTFSLTSTANLYTSAQPPSTTTTPGKVPPSPLYYDYTEDFEVEVFHELTPLEPPPPFRIDKTIPEDRPMSSERPPSKGIGSSNGYDAFQVSPPGRSIPLKFKEDGQSNEDGLLIREENPPAVQSIPAGTDAAPPGYHGTISRDRKCVGISGLGYGAQQLKSHVDEAFGNFPSSALEITDPNKLDSGSIGESPKAQTPSESLEKDLEQPSARSSYSMITSIPHFPSPPIAQDILQTKDAVEIALDKSTADPSVKPMGSQKQVGDPGLPIQPSLMSEQQGIDASPNDARKSSFRDRENMRLSDINHSGIMSTEQVDVTEAGNRHRGAHNNHSVHKSVRRTPMISPTVPERLKLRNTDPEDGNTAPMSLFNRRRAADGETTPLIQPLKRSHYCGGGRLDISGISNHNSANVPNFSHQIPKKDMPPRSESPMLAPKPISPARQLKLKNSVPQLMKALPPLPPELLSRPGSPTSQPLSEDVELPCKFSPLARNLRSSPVQLQPEVPPRIISPRSTQKLENDRGEELHIAEVVPTAAEEIVSLLGDSGSSLPPPRMKLKIKSTGSQRPTSPLESHPWNLAESYPWSSPTPSVRLPLIPDPQVPASKPLKFKLKVTRASNSTQGTVRVNRESGESKRLAGLHLRNPKDLFTPSIGIDNIFRQVNRHLHSRKASMASSHAGQNDTNIPSSSILNSTSTTRTPSADRQLPSMSANPGSTSEARSVFSDDSSHVHGNHSLRLRGRLSNLRARIAAPYANRAGTQSHDDITWRDRHGAEAHIPPASRSIPDLHSNRKSTDSVRPMRRWVEKARRQKLKAKVHVQGWLKEAKLAIVTRVRARSAAPQETEEI